MSWYKDSLQFLGEQSIPHRNYVKITRETASRIYFSIPGEIIFIVGPTRVGKSYLAKKVMETLYGVLTPDQQHFPYVFVTAANESTAGAFSTRGFTRDALEAAEHPIYSDEELSLDFSKLYHSVRNKTENQMRSDLVRALKLRKVNVVVCDEMQNIRFVPGGYAKAAWFLDSLKCVAAQAGVILVIIGTYELLSIRDLCPQIIGRSDTLHYSRYRINSESDMEAWDQLLQTYSLHIPTGDNSRSLMDWRDFLYDGSLGCFGLLNKWLRSAISEAHLEKSDCLKEKHLSNALRSNKERVAVEESIKFGEEYMSNPDYGSFKEYLEKYQDKPMPTPKKKRGQPFQRKAQRLTGKERVGEKA